MKKRIVIVLVLILVVGVCNSFAQNIGSKTKKSSCSIKGNLIDIESIDDMNGNGFPETVKLGVDFKGAPLVCISDIKKKKFIKEIYFFTSGWVPKFVKVFEDMNKPADGVKDISVTAFKISTGKTRMQVRDTNSGNLLHDIKLP